MNGAFKIIETLIRNDYTVSLEPHGDILVIEAEWGVQKYEPILLHGEYDVLPEITIIEHNKNINYLMASWTINIGEKND